MKSSLFLAVVGLSVSLSPAVVCAQHDGVPATTSTSSKADKQSAQANDPAAKDLVEKCRSAIRGLTDISCTVTQTMVNEKATTKQTGDLVAAIEHEGEGQGSLKRFRIASKGEDFDAIWSFDGETAYKIDNSAKTFASLKAPDGKAMPLPEVGMVLPTWALGTDVLSAKEARLAAARILPDAEIDGVKCRVVEYRVETIVPEGGAERSDDEKGKSDEPLKMVTEQVRHIGAADMIPRKIESRVFFAGPWKELPADRKFTGIYSKMKVNANPSTEAFTLAAPTGFKTIEGDERDLGIPSNKMPKLKFVAGDAAPEFALKTPDGTEVTLASFKGRVVLLDFWATWCGPCKMAMPGVQSLHEKYQGKPVSIFGVDTFEPGAGAKAAKYMADQKFNYGLLLEGDPLAKKYGIGSIPTFVLIGRDGKVIYTGIGFHKGHDEEIAKLIDKALPGT